MARLQPSQAAPRLGPRLAAILARMVEAKLAVDRSLPAPSEGMVRPPRRNGAVSDARHSSR